MHDFRKKINSSIFSRLFSRFLKFFVLILSCLGLDVFDLVLILILILSITVLSWSCLAFKTRLLKILNLCIPKRNYIVFKCVTLYWMSSLAVGLFQNIVIILPKVRRCLRIPETARDLDKPFEYMKQEIAYKFRKFSK